MTQKAIVVGASGLIGSRLLDILLAEDTYQQVLVIVRKPLALEHKKLQQLVIEFDRLADYTNRITGDAVFSCLGTTRAQTPDRKKYYQIDHDYPVQLAAIARQNKIPQFHLVSSVGADPTARSFYTKLKGETERDVALVGPATQYFYEPSFLMGRQQGQRTGERLIDGLMKGFNPLLVGSWKKYRSVSAETVARTMFETSRTPLPGKFIVQFEAGRAVAHKIS